MAHYIGIDVGTGAARACIVNEQGDIIGVASENTGLWQPKRGYYEQSTSDIWRCICAAVRKAVSEREVDVDTIKGIGFDATCSLAVFDHDTDQPISLTGPDFDQSGNDQNVILWLDHRAVEETNKINATGHHLLTYVGGSMSIEMEMPKILWLKNHMPKELFGKCKFYDLTDALVHLATGNEKRSFCSVVCKQGYVPTGVDGSVKGWQEDFMADIGLEDLCKDNFIRIGGIQGVNGDYLSAGEFAGYLTEKSAVQLGLPIGVAVGSGVIDAYAGWIGTVGAKVPGEDRGPSCDIRSQMTSRLAAVAGTSTCHLVMCPEPIFVNGVWGPYRDCIFRGFWLAEGGQSATGELLRHVLEIHPAFKEATALAAASNVNIYDYLNQHLRQMEARSGAPSITYLNRHFFLYGDLFGNRSPIADAAMTGSIAGLTADVSVDGLARHYYGTMEFIALQTLQIINTMNASGHSIKSIFMSGSQCNNDILMSLIATACNMPVVIPRYVNAAVCHGAAMLGAKAASVDKRGETTDLWTIMDRMSKPGRIVRPSVAEGVSSLLRVKYQVFLEQCERQREFRRMVDAVTKNT